MLAKLALMYAIARIGGEPNDAAQRLAVSISQGGEFAFILFVAAGSLGIFEAGTPPPPPGGGSRSLLLAPPPVGRPPRPPPPWCEGGPNPGIDPVTRTRQPLHPARS